MKATPDAPRRLGCAFYGAAFEGDNFCAGRVEKQLDFLLDSGDLQGLEGDDLVTVVDWGQEVKRGT